MGMAYSSYCTTCGTATDYECRAYKTNIYYLSVNAYSDQFYQKVEINKYGQYRKFEKINKKDASQGVSRKPLKLSRFHLAAHKNARQTKRYDKNLRKLNN